MKRTMISQPMPSKNDDKTIRELGSLGYITIHYTWSTESRDEIKHVELEAVGNSLKMMALCDAVYFCAGWEKNRACRLQFEAASKFGLEILFESPPSVKMHGER